MSYGLKYELNAMNNELLSMSYEILDTRYELRLLRDISDATKDTI
jgi:hypothetical protein